MLPRVLGVDADGVRLERGFDGSFDVHFDGWRGWSAPVSKTDDAVQVAWPKRLKDRLEGRSLVTITVDDVEVFREELSFGSGEGRVELVDRFGNPVIIDKWGLLQRPFESRRDAGAVEAMTEMAERVLAVMRRECGLDGWISFGTLLGAARSGSVIGHDSDIDLCFLSDKATPAEMAIELWDVARALHDAGISVKHKTASFLTVVYRAPDGVQDGIDIYTCFHIDGLLHETATVRAPVPRGAILPLRTLEFEGRQMPAPADPDRLLTVSYGPNWRVPDPSFRHEPSREISDRFDAWFGALMPQRREWTQLSGQLARSGSGPSGFAHWVTDQVTGSPRIVDIGSGPAFDLRHYAARGLRAIGYDYAQPSQAALGEELPEGVQRRQLNLLDERDVLATGAILARSPRRQVVTARRLLEALPPPARPRFWRLAAMALRSGGEAFLEGVSRSQHECHRHMETTGSPRVWPVDPTELEPLIRSAGGRVTHREGFAAASRATRTGSPATWRLRVQWPTLQEETSSP